MNSMYFTSKQVENGEMMKFVKTLTDMCYTDSGFYNDVHIKPSDCGSFTVEWEQLPWDGSYGGRFVFLEEDETVMLEKIFPDNHIEVCFDEDDYNERLQDWLKENPGWVKTSYGTWTNMEENKKFMKELGGGNNE